MTRRRDPDDARPIGAAWLAVLAGTAMLALAVSVGLTAVVQIGAARQATERTAAAQRMLIAMLDQETGLRGYNLNGLDEFLRPYQQGRADFGQALNDSRSAMEGDRNGQALLAEQAQISDEWRQLASVAVTQARLRDTRTPPAPGSARPSWTASGSRTPTISA
ncbi:MAG: CHASE3 domain-containing protein [Baekduiaceae bacterium]